MNHGEEAEEAVAEIEFLGQGGQEMSITTAARVVKHVDVAIKQVDAERRHIVFVASQEIVDRDDDVILVDGIDTTEFARNPVLLGDHDRGFVLGRVTAFRREARPGGRAFVCEADILPPGTSARVDEAWAAIQFGARNGISLGFQPLEYDRDPVREGQRGYTFRRVALLEISSVSLPSCPTCLIEQKAWQGRSRTAECGTVVLEQSVS